MKNVTLAQPISAISSLKLRMPWRVASVLLKDCDLPTSQGWERTLSKLPDELDEAQNDKLTEALLQHIVCGDKNVRVYQADDLDLETVKAAVKQFTDKSSVLTRTYPRVLTGEDLADVEPGRPEIVHSFETDKAFYLTFASNTEVSIRHLLDRDLIASAIRDGNDELAETLRDSHEILAIHIERRHAFAYCRNAQRNKPY